MISPAIRKRIRERLSFIYDNRRAVPVVSEIELLVELYRPQLEERRDGWSERDVMLITYADSIVSNDEEPLRTLHRFLKERIGEAVTFVHLLPFYPFSSDDGFAVIDFRKVREGLGEWDDVEAMAADYRLVFDGVINHVSADSVYMRGYCAGDPDYADFFIALPPDTDTSSVLRTRNLPLLHDYETSEGVKWLWTTFSRDQVDLNYHNPEVLVAILDVLLFYAARGASAVRLDAIPYLWKELGTSCAHLPRTHALIKLMRDVYDEAAPWMILMAECNVPWEENVAYLGNAGDEAQIVYNFTLAPLILYTLVQGDATKLTRWASGLGSLGPGATLLNITATHDGIGMRPTEGLLTEAEREELMQLAADHHGGVTGKRNADGSVSPYELNLNYFDAVNNPDAEESLDVEIDRFMLSQAIPLAFAGIPTVYIHSLLGSRNDLEGVRRTGRVRSINREQLRLTDLQKELEDADSLRRRVLDRYLRLLEIRREQSAFHPAADQEVLRLAPSIFAVRRRNATTGQTILALHNVTAVRTETTADTACVDLLTGDAFKAGDVVPLDPYQVRWLQGR